MARKVIRYGILGIALMLLAVHSGVLAQVDVDPSALPLLTERSFTYVGGFRLPASEVNGDSFAGGGIAAAFNPANRSLFVSSYRGTVAEVTIPMPKNSADSAALPVASFLQPFADPTEGRINEATLGHGGGIADMVVYGNRLYGNAQVYYDANNDQRRSHYSRSLKLNEPSFVGWASVWQPEKTGFVSGFMSVIPREWQAKLGGQLATGQCCIPIVSRTSFGPSAFAFDPARIAKGVTVPAQPLLYYDSEHQTLGKWMNISEPNEIYNQSTEIHGFAIINGTRTAAYIGRHGTGVPCYGNGTNNKSLVGKVGPDGALWCYDLDQSSKGSHAWPYRYQIWAYDLNDFAAVKAGKKRPWQVVPYGVWPLKLPTPGNEVRLGGASYDAERQILYIAQRLADSTDQSYRPIIHAVKVTLQ